MQNLNEKNMGKHFQIGIIPKLASFANWHLIWSPQHLFHGHTSKRLAYYRTTAVSLLFDVGFLGQIVSFERCLRGGPFPTQRHQYTQCRC